jgi:tetratricopeptide (TPR) repeat protein
LWPNEIKESRLELKRETVAVGAICLLLGGLIGYISGTQIAFKQINETARPAGNQPGSGFASSPSQNAAPEGHPAITTSADLETLKKAADAAPNNSTLAIEFANKLYDAARYDEAIPYYKRALTLEPQNVNVSTDLGTALFYTGNPDAAIAQFNWSLQVDPKHGQTLHNLVVVNLQGKKDLNAARAALDRLKSVDPNNPSIPNLQNMIASPGVPQTNPRQTLF